MEFKKIGYVTGCLFTWAAGRICELLTKSECAFRLSGFPLHFPVGEIPVNFDLFRGGCLATMTFAAEMFISVQNPSVRHRGQIIFRFVLCTGCIRGEGESDLSGQFEGPISTYRCPADNPKRIDPVFRMSDQNHHRIDSTSGDYLYINDFS